MNLSSDFFIDSLAQNDYNCRMEFLGKQVHCKKGRAGSIRLSVKEGEIFLEAGSNFTEEELLAFLQKHKRFIAKRLENKESSKEAFPELYDYSAVLVAGNKYALCLSQKSKIEGKTVYVRQKQEVPYLLEMEYGRAFANRVLRYGEYLGVTVSKISFGKGKSKWGSCDTLGRLFFSRAVLMLPLALGDYVIVHELCHRKQMNHSPLFWKEVERIFPDWKERRQALKKYEFLIGLYEMAF